MSRPTIAFMHMSPITAMLTYRARGFTMKGEVRLYEVFRAIQKARALLNRKEKNTPAAKRLMVEVPVNPLFITSSLCTGGADPEDTGTLYHGKEVFGRLRIPFPLLTEPLNNGLSIEELVEEVGKIYRSPGNALDDTVDEASCRYSGHVTRFRTGEFLVQTEDICLFDEGAQKPTLWVYVFDPKYVPTSKNFPWAKSTREIPYDVTAGYDLRRVLEAGRRLEAEVNELMAKTRKGVKTPFPEELETRLRKEVGFSFSPGSWDRAAFDGHPGIQDYGNLKCHLHVSVMMRAQHRANQDDVNWRVTPRLVTVPLRFAESMARMFEQLGWTEGSAPLPD